MPCVTSRTDGIQPGNALGDSNKVLRRSSLGCTEDEVPHHVLAHVSGSLPCIAMDTNGRVDILISKDQLAGCDGDFTVFEHLLARKLRGLASEPIPAPRFN